jgi:hypothetical protein
MRTALRAAGLAALLLALPAGCGDAPAAPDAPAAKPPAAANDAAGSAATRATMGQIVDSLAFVLPLSLDDASFSDPAQRQAILAALDALAANGAKVTSHVEGRDAGFAFLSRSLARDTEEIRDRYAAGRTAEARFLLLEVTDNCAACHSRLPDSREHPVGRRLVDDPRVAALDLDERVNLEVATRQFDRALTSYEALFADPARPAADLDLQGHVDGYLEVVLRVENDPERALRAITLLSKREDLPASLRENAGAWTRSLGELAKRERKGTPLEQARALIEQAQDSERYPDDRAALVDYVAASAILHRFISSQQTLGPQVAESCWWLGLIESRIGRSFWLSQTEFFLEQSIRLAPQKPFARDAYELLEEFEASGYSGSQGSEVPKEVRERLAELKRLIDHAQGS